MFFPTQLQHGLFLNRKNFPDFVESFNWIGERLRNIKGDFDADPDNGFIQIDNTDEKHPVIRLTNTNKLVKQNDGYDGCFEIDWDSKSFKNPYVQVGNQIRECQTVIGLTGLEGQVVAVKMRCDGLTDGPLEMTKVSSLGELQKKQTEENYIYCALYMFNEDGKVVCDFRKGAVMPKFEIFDETTSFGGGSDGGDEDEGTNEE